MDVSGFAEAMVMEMMSAGSQPGEFDHINRAVEVTTSLSQSTFWRTLKRAVQREAWESVEQSLANFRPASEGAGLVD